MDYKPRESDIKKEKFVFCQDYFHMIISFKSPILKDSNFFRLPGVGKIQVRNSDFIENFNYSYLETATQNEQTFK